MKKLLLFLMISLLLIGTVSGFEWDNVKEYNEETKTVSIANSILWLWKTDEIARIRLVTPQNYQVIDRGPGVLQKVAELEFISFDNKYNNAMRDMDFYQINNGMRKVNQNFEYRYRTEIGTDTFPIEETVCEDVLSAKNGTEKRCYKQQTGTSEVPVYSEWKTFKEVTELSEGVVRVGIFTDVGSEDYIEWIPTFFGVRISEWASWSSSLNVGLVSYYDLEGETNFAIDSVRGQNNMTNDSTIRGVDGIIGNGTRFDAPIGNLSTTSVYGSNPADFTIQAWIYANESIGGANRYIISEREDLTLLVRLETNSSIFGSYDLTVGGGQDFNGPIIATNTWNHIVIRGISNQEFNIFLNGTLIINHTIASTFEPRNANTVVIGDTNILQGAFNGTIDEVGFWNRSLSVDEIGDLYNAGAGIARVILLGSTVTLNSPEDNADVILSASQDFNSTATSRVGSLTNATFYAWDSLHTVLEKTTNIVTSPITGTNSTIFSTSFGTTAVNNKWNVEYCTSNLTDTFCEFARNNRTFDVILFSINTQDFTPNVTETSSQKFEVNISVTPSILSVSARLNYNNTVIGTSTSSCEGVLCNIISTIDIPLIEGSHGSENKTFKWELTLFDGSSSSQVNTSISEQNVSRIDLEQCDATFTVKALNFTAFDEQNLSRLAPFQFDGTFNFWTGSGLIKKNSSISANITEMNVCLKPTMNMKIDGIIDYDEDTNISSYTNRFYYFDNYTINASLQHIPLFLLRSVSSTSFILKVQDENLLPVRDALIEIHRFYPGEGIFKIVQIAKTDDNGKSIGFFQTETVDYKFIIKKGGTILLETGQQKVIPETSPFTLTFNIGTDLGDPWESQNEIPSLESSLIWDEDTGNVTYTYVDTSTSFTQARLLVQKVSLTNSSAYIVLCNDTSLLTAATITCAVGTTGGFYIASAFITRTGEALDRQISFSIESFSSASGLLGLFFGMFLILIASFMFKFNEVAGIWATTVTIFLVNLMGLIKFGAVFVTAIIAIAIILTWVMEK